MTDEQKKEILNSLKNNGLSPRDVYVNGEIGGIRIGTSMATILVQT